MYSALLKDTNTEDIIMLRTSITPEGRFLVGIHSPSYEVTNLRQHDHFITLGFLTDNSAVDNALNFPDGDIVVETARAVYEILNPLPFRGCSYIDSGWAATKAADPVQIQIPPAPSVSLRNVLGDYCPSDTARKIILQLPHSLRYELAATSTDHQELVWLAQSCCQMVFSKNGDPVGLRYIEKNGSRRAMIDDFELYETVANNPYLPDVYKEIMVLRPGVQGSSEIVGDYFHHDTDIFEYLRSNSYVPWGHYAANFAPTSIRYRISDLSQEDMEGLRHLYYQRIFVTVAEKLGIEPVIRRRRYTPAELEGLRDAILHAMASGASCESLATLWGWNFGYDFSGSGYRLHASHQMIHQQYALSPQWVADTNGGQNSAYCCGDLVADVVERYSQDFHSDFFNDYLKALANNTRTDGALGDQSLTVWQDQHVLLFVPKAQVSQWELQLMVTADCAGVPVGNIIEADPNVRRSLDTGILKAQQALAGLGAKMVTSIEYSKRLGVLNGQRLLYAFLPKLPWSMGGFSEAQGRFILGHYPEDFAVACRHQLG
jgi:hypothetical protein